MLPGRRAPWPTLPAPGAEFTAVCLRQCDGLLPSALRVLWARTPGGHLSSTPRLLFQFHSQLVQPSRQRGPSAQLFLSAAEELGQALVSASDMHSVHISFCGSVNKRSCGFSSLILFLRATMLVRTAIPAAELHMLLLSPSGLGSGPTVF